ncbi:MAG: response regulator [Desulfovibrionaceae bacterium]|nr:response regulator [Desulfovibrionaceae bacterium]
MKCLIIDDDFNSRMILKKFLQPFGRSDVVTDGEEGVLAFQRALAEKTPYRLVTLDLLMPNSDGQQTLRELREIEKEFGVDEKDSAKIIIISGLDNTPQLHDAFSLGSATGYMVKPIRRKAFLEELEKLGVILVKK